MDDLVATTAVDHPVTNHDIPRHGSLEIGRPAQYRR